MASLALALLTSDPVTLLAIGVVALIVTAIAYGSGQRSVRSKPSASTTDQPRSPLDAVTANSAMFRARAAARARSSATAAATATPKATPRYMLQNVRTVISATAVESERPDAGQEPQQADGPELDQATVRELSSAIAFHVATHDPERMAEVIRLWIKSDQKTTKPGRA